MRFVLLHPSRGRAQKALETFQYWLSKANGINHSIQHILSIDVDDPNKLDYYRLFNGESDHIVCSQNKNVVEATNVAAMLAEGDILIYLSDDFKCPDQWDELIADRLRPLDHHAPHLLKVDDCLQPYHVKVLTIPIMTMALYKKLGYFWHPGYRSMFVDEDLYHTCANNDWLVDGERYKFPHEHPANGKAEDDETYRRSAANWDQGKEFFAQRKADGFPL